MYAHVGIHTMPLCLARGDCSIVTRRDRFHLWSRMVMTPTPWRRSGERERVTGSHRSSGPRVQVGKPGSQAARQDEESRIGDTHINLHIFGPHPSTLGPRGNPRAPGQPVRRFESFAEWTLNGFFCRSGIRDFAAEIHKLQVTNWRTYDCALSEFNTKSNGIHRRKTRFAEKQCTHVFNSLDYIFLAYWNECDDRIILFRSPTFRVAAH